MPLSLPRRLKTRYARRLEPGGRALEELVEAIQRLLQVTSQEDPLFLAHGLDLLVAHLHCARACLIAVAGQRLVTQWWSPEQPGAPEQVPSICRWLLENPHRTLVLRDIPREPCWGHDPDLRRLDIQAAAGLALHENDRLRALVVLSYHAPHPFTRAELAFLVAVAGYLGRVLEIETLRSALRDLENSLAITRAVVEDSSIQDPATGLPNRRYLEIWLKANLAAATREHETMTVALWCLCVETSEGILRMQAVAERIRAGDLLVSMGRGHFLLVLQRMPKGLGQIFLNRLGRDLGALPMGATLWVPECDDLRLESVLKRLELAVEESRAQTPPRLVWRI